MKNQVTTLLVVFVFTILIFTQTSVAVNSTNISVNSNNSTCNIVIKDIKTQTMVFKGKTIEITSKITNLGKNRSGGFYVDYFLRNYKSKYDTYLGSRYVNGLVSGETKSQKLTFKLPKNITCNYYYVRILADSTFCLNEINRTNNIGYCKEKTQVVIGRPVYITSDNIKNSTKDNARMDRIVSGLGRLGLYAVNYGLGPNKHYSVLKNVNVPQNAIIVNIYGGACAGTIWEMTQKYYKTALGSRKVYSIWINTQINVGTVQFLKRSSDDNYTPKYGENGGFPQFQDSNQNGIFEPNIGEKDGITNPGELLRINGYHYLYQQDGDINTIIKAIFEEATT